MNRDIFAIIALTVICALLYNYNSKLSAMNSFLKSQKPIIEIEKQLDRLDNKLDQEIERQKEIERKRKQNAQTIDSDINSLVDFFNKR